MNSQNPFDFPLDRPTYHDLSEKIPFAGCIARHKPHSLYRYDMHYGFEIGIVLKGRMRIYFHDYTAKLQPGNIWFCGMWEPHGWSAGREPYEEVNLVVWPPALAAWRCSGMNRFNWLAPFNVLPEKRPQTSGKARLAMLGLGRKIKERLQLREKTWEWLHLSIMEAILLSTDGWLEEAWSTTRQAKPAARLNLVLQQIFDNRGSRMTTREAAGICGMNRNAFGKMFRDLMGIHFSDFILRHRLNAAASSLRQTEDPVKSIALACGFADTSHFDRLFAKHYGCAPHEYRRKSFA